ncbi:hypothetical protein Clacol_003961 [Clathrus columnatus]|uniref:Uncharacterized protein n=1 Tax=Clathrus columnatus TaxID=1419009 RepID=A0AAV5A588_9AGAM|nr:hypothetical protein Clacol_003961 [Clathrus columnatus]
MTTLYSPSLSPAQWRSRSLKTQASADNLPSFNPSRSTLTSPNKPRFNLSSVIRFGTKSKKNRVTDIIQDPPEDLYAIPISVPVSKLQHKASDLNLESNINPRFSRGVSSTSGTSRASTDGPLTPSDDLRMSYQHSLMTLSDGIDPSATSAKSGHADEKRQSTHSDKSLKRRIKDRLNGDRDTNKSSSLTGRNDKQPASKERSSITPSSRVRSSVLAEMSSDKQPRRAEAINQERLNTPLSSPVSFQHPFVLAEAIPATLLDAHASAHPRKLSDSTYYSYGSFGTTMSSISRSPTMISTSTSKSAPAPELNFVSPIKSRFMRKSVSTYSSAPPLSNQSSMASLKVSISQGNLKRAAPGSILREGPSSGAASPRNDSPHPPPTSSLPPTPSETEEQPDIRSLSSSLYRAPSSSASIRHSSTVAPLASGPKSSTLNPHLTPTLKAVASGSTVSLSTISSLAFAARPSTYGGSNSGGRSRSASRAGSVSASIPEQDQENVSPGNGFNSRTGTGGLESMIDMTEDSEEEESEIEFGDEEDILQNNDVFRNASQRPSTTSPKAITPSSTVPNAVPSQLERHASSFVRTLTSSTASVLRRQRSFHNSTSGSSNVPNDSTSAAASTSEHPSSTSPVRVPSNPSLQAKLNSRSHPYTPHTSHTSQTRANQESNQVHTQSRTLQQQQQHQGQAPRHMGVLRHHTSFDPGMGGGSGGVSNATTGTNVSFSTSGVNGIVGTTTTNSDNAGKVGTVHIFPNYNSADSRSINNDTISLGRNPTGRSPATSIHSLQLQMQSSDNINQVPQPSKSLYDTTSPTSEKRRLLGVRRERSEHSLGTVVEPSDPVRQVFPTPSENPVVVSLLKSKGNNPAEQAPSPKLGQPISALEETTRTNNDDVLPYRRRAKSSWGSNGTMATSFLSGDSIPPPQSSSRYGSSGLMRHALSSSDLYNSANRGDGLLVVVRNEFNDGDPNFTSLPPPPRKTKTTGFSANSGVNSLGMETGRSRGRKDSNEKKEKDKSRKRSRSKSKSKSKSDETTILDDPQPSFLDMGSGRNVILTFEGDKEVVWDGEPVSTIGLPPKIKGSSGRHRGHDRLHDTEPIRLNNHSYSHRHPYGYRESAYSPIVESSPSPLTSISASPLTSPSPPPFSPYRRGQGEDSFLELSRGHESIDLTDEDLRFVRY